MKRYREGVLMLVLAVALAGCKTTETLTSVGVAWLDSAVADYLAKVTLVVPPVQEPAPVIPEAPVTPVVPETPAVVQNVRFRYWPDGDAIVFEIYDGHWQYSICTTTPAVHHKVGLWPNTRGGGVSVPGGGTRYRLLGSGEKWRNDAIALDPKGGGAIVVFWNLNKADPVTTWTASHQVVPDPRVKHEVLR